MLTRRIKYIIMAIAVVAVGGCSLFVTTRGSGQKQYESATVERKNLLQQVSVTGTVKAITAANLGFERSGRVAKVHVAVGDSVKMGQILAELGHQDLDAQRAEANAGIAIAKAQLQETNAEVEHQALVLDQVKTGTRPEELRLAATNVRNAGISVSDAEKNQSETQKKAGIDLVNVYGDVEELINSAYLKAEDALRRQTDHFFENPDSNDPKLTFVVGRDAQVEMDLKKQRIESGQALKTVQEVLVNRTKSFEQKEAGLKTVQQSLEVIRTYLNKANEALNKSTGLQGSTLNGYKNDVSMARDTINNTSASISNQLQLIATQKSANQSAIVMAETKMNEARSALENAQRQLELKRAGATPSEIATQRSLLEKAQKMTITQQAHIAKAVASQKAVEAELDKSLIRAPFDGIVTRQEAKLGETASVSTLSSDPSEGVMAMIDPTQFEIEASIPEVDIAKVKLGDRAQVTLDAYGSEENFKARVASIDPAETLIEGIATYKVKLRFNKNDPRIKSGMTANVDIATAERTNVIVIPERAITTLDGKKTVRVVTGEGKKAILQERQAVTGLHGSDGNTEILQGLKEGEKVVVFIEE